ncbi:MAG TPA: hypothetical protein VHX38_18840 [Pseudonocardiaceae bacterium]|jgi:hypothetical protein|nr:hypothetical protein [Pseudonocardiaceae bacterium]
MTDFSENRIGNWVFTAYGLTMPLPADLTQRVKQPVPNRSERRRAAREALRNLRAAQPATPAIVKAPEPADLIGDVSNWQPTGLRP